MIVPLGVIYILANMTFQMAVKNSSEDGLNCTQCWNYTVQLPHLKYFNAFKLMHWYYNPALWVIILCFGQALSHLFERKCTGVQTFSSELSQVSENLHKSDACLQEVGKQASKLNTRHLHRMTMWASLQPHIIRA